MATTIEREDHSKMMVLMMIQFIGDLDNYNTALRDVRRHCWCRRILDTSTAGAGKP